MPGTPGNLDKQFEGNATLFLSLSLERSKYAPSNEDCLEHYTSFVDAKRCTATMPSVQTFRQYTLIRGPHGDASTSGSIFDSVYNTRVECCRGHDARAVHSLREQGSGPRTTSCDNMLISKHSASLLCC